ncbi:fimbrial protein [Kerstersia sp.]|uniref:fimbrial protein n=1 Tax=Kerstersia sp. TaxID=1930783 RepID=UPI003F938BEC
MKSTVLNTLGLAAFLAASGAAQAQNTVAGTISLYGRIYSDTCDVVINGQPGNSTSVPMGNYPVSAFNNTTGTTVGGNGVNGQIELSLANCPPGQKVFLQLNAKEVTDYPEAIELDNANASDTAKNVGIHLYEGDSSTPMVLGRRRDYTIPQGSSGSYELYFTAKYVSTKSNVEAGKADATVNYTLTYQ